MSKKNQDWNERFLIHLDSKPDIGIQRKKKYISQLKYIAEWYPGEDYAKATKHDIEQLVAKVLKGKVHRVKKQPDGTVKAVPTKQDMADASKSDYLTAIKSFWRWLRNEEAGKQIYNPEDPHQYPPEVMWIRKKGLRIKSAVQSKEEFLTDEEFDRMLRAADLKYRALWSILREKGPRVNEVLTCKIKDFNLIDTETATLALAHNIKGKTEYSKRVVGLADSVPAIKWWLEIHPNRNNPEAWLFPNDGNNHRGGKLTQAAARMKLQRTARKVGITKRVWHHLFRHEAITKAKRELNLSDDYIKLEFGFSDETKVMGNYKKLTNDDSRMAYFVAKGKIKVGDKPKSRTEIKKCQWCGCVNPFTSDYCKECARPLNPADIQKLVEVNELGKVLAAWIMKEEPEILKRFSEFYKTQKEETIEVR